MTAGVSANAGENFDVVAIDEPETAFGVALDELLNVVGVNAAVIAAGLPGCSRVIVELLFLNPDIGFGKKIDAAEMIPVRMADDDVGDFIGLEARELDGFVGAEVIGRWEIFEKSVAVVAAEEKNEVAADADQPNDHGYFDFFVFGSAHDEAGDFILGGAVADGLDGIVRCGGVCGNVRKLGEECG